VNVKRVHRLEQAEVAAIVEQRSLKQQSKFVSVLTEKNLETVAEDLGGCGADEDLKADNDKLSEALKMAKKLNVPKPKPIVLSTTSKAYIDKHVEAKAASGVVGPVAGHDADSVAPDIPYKVYTAAEARKFMPTSKGVSIWIHTKSAWMVKYDLKPDFPKSHTCTYVDADDESHYRCMILCLRWIWREYNRLNPADPCPYNLGVPL
jgi:hypothetical protein